MSQQVSNQVRVAIIYYSATGSVYELAQAVREGAEKAGADVRVRKVQELAPQEAIESNEGWSKHSLETQDVPEATADDILWADAVIFGTPTRYGNVAAQLKQFLDTLGPQWAQGLLANKVYSGFVSTATAHGGQESTLLALYNTVHHFGGLIVTPGYTDPSKFVDGNPYGTSHIDAQGQNPVGEQTRNAARVQAERVVKVTKAFRSGAA